MWLKPPSRQFLANKYQTKPWAINGLAAPQKTREQSTKLLII